MPIPMKGVAASIGWGYHHAATLGPWNLSDAGGGQLTAEIVSADAFRVSQQPLTFLVPRPNGQPRRWPITSLQIADSTLTAVVGPQE